MAQVVKVRRLANPRRRNAGRRVGRRKMTAKQIKHFGTRRQKAALKAARARKRRKPAAHRRRTNPVTRIVKKVVHVYHNRKRKAAKKAHRRRRTSNPAPVVLTLGAVNPQHKRRSMAQRKRKRASSHKRNPSRRRRTRIVVSAPHHRRRNTTYHRRRRKNPIRHHRRRRNPTLFGSNVASVSTAKMIVGGLVGVAAAKFIPTLLPSTMTSNSIVKLVATGASAFVASFVARKAGLSEQVAGAVLFGGLMLTGSVAINMLLPASIATRLALSGLGDLVPGQFPVPQNPLRLPPPAVAIASNARTTVSGLDRAYGRSI